MNKPLKILITDDNDSDRLILAAMVKKHGHQVILACDGIEAIEQFKQHHPDIVLLDALMPNMDGFTAAPHIKALAGDSFVPIIFLTSLTDDESLIKGLEAGGDDFLAKPYNSNVIKSKIDAFDRMRYGHKKLQLALSDLEASQNKLIEREKMASLGDLVAGVAHEINTPIGIGVTSASHMNNLIRGLKQSFDAGELDQTILENFLSDANESATITQTNLSRAAELVRSFKQVAVDQSCGKIRDINLDQHLHDILLSLQPKLKRFKHQIRIDAAKDISCQCDAGALTQIITNLIMNSINHAFDDNELGTIEIIIHADPETIYIDYRDNGHGMSVEHLNKIFEPFFTTKRGQGGSGLGTHIIYNQVNQALHGNIQVNSVLGEGLQFLIDFPVSSKNTAD